MSDQPQPDNGTPQPDQFIEPPPPASPYDYIEPPAAPTPQQPADPQTKARAAGYSWPEIDDHIARATQVAFANGYDQEDIDRHLGYSSPDSFIGRARDQWSSRMASDPSIIEKLTGPQPELDIAGPDAAQAYAAALQNREVKGPQDFAEHYAAAALDAAHNVIGLEPGDDQTVQAKKLAAAQAADSLAAGLPGARDVTDAALSLQTDYGTASQNLMDNWLATGQHPLDAAMRASTDPSWAAALTSGLTGNLLAPGAAPISESIPATEFAKGIGRGVTSLIGGLAGIGETATRALADMTGSEALKGIVDSHAKEWAGRETEWAKALAPDEGITAFISGELGETIPTIGEFMAAGVPAMVAYGVMNGANEAFRATGSAAASAVGAVIGGASMVAPAYFMSASGKGLVESAVKAAIGMGLYGGVQSFANPLIAMAAGQGYRAPSAAQVAESGLGAAVQGALFGALSTASKPRVAIIDPSNPDAPARIVPADEAMEIAPAKTVTNAEGEESFAPEATPAEKLNALADRLENMRLTREGVLPDEFSNPSFFRDLAQNEDQATKDLALGRDTARGTLAYMRGFVRDLLNDQRGSGEIPIPGGGRVEPLRPEDQIERPREEPKREDPQKTIGDHLQDIYDEAHSRLSPQDHARLNAIAQEIGDIPNTGRTAEQQARVAQLQAERDTIIPPYAELRRQAEGRAEPAVVGGGRAEPAVVGGGRAEPAPEPGPAPMTPRQKADTFRQLMRQYINEGEQSIYHFTGMLNDLRRFINPALPEWQLELKKLREGRDGDPMSTKIGIGLDYIEGVTPPSVMSPDGTRVTATVDHNNPLKDQFDIMRDINADLHGKMMKAVADGVIDEVGFVDGYFKHFFKQSEDVRTWALGAGAQGSNASFKSRTGRFPTIGDALRAGKELAIEDPLDLMIYKAAAEAKFLAHSYAMKDMLDIGLAYRSDKPQSPTDAKLDGRFQSMGENTLWAPAKVARLYNNIVSTGWYTMPEYGDWYQKAMYLRNTMVQVKLLWPMFHAAVITEQTLATGMQQVMTELGAGHPLRAARDLAMTGTVVPMAARIAREGREALNNYADVSGDRVMQTLVKAGGRFGSRQALFRDMAPSIYASIAQNRGHVMEAAGRELSREVGQVLGSPEESMAKRLLMAAPRTLNMGALNASRAATLVSAPLFDTAIPTMKAGAAAMRMKTYFDYHPDASEAARDKRARQIVDNIDDRFGEFNYNNLFWNKWFKQTAMLTMISPSWAYGTWRWFAAANLYNFQHGFEWNPEATSSLYGGLAVYVGFNALMNYVHTGQMPQDVWDMLNFRTGGTTSSGAPERGLLPTEFKELYDIGSQIGKVLGGTTTPEGAAFNYLNGKTNGLVRMIEDRISGVDAIGHRIGQTPGGWREWLLRSIEPIVLSNERNAKLGTGLNAFERGFIREAPGVIEDPSKFMGTQQWLSDKWTREELQRAKREAAQTGSPMPEDTTTTGNFGGAVGTFGGAVGQTVGGGTRSGGGGSTPREPNTTSQDLLNLARPGSGGGGTARTPRVTSQDLMGLARPGTRAPRNETPNIVNPAQLHAIRRSYYYRRHAQ